MYDSDIHHRRSIRIKGFDYAQDGAYFVTICVKGGQCLFGDVADGKMILNEAGEMVDRWWRKLPQKFPEIELDEFATLPNHFHGIIVIRSVGAIPCNRPAPVRPEFSVKRNTGEGEKIQEGENMVSPVRIQNTYSGLGRYVSWFKRMVVDEYAKNVKFGKFPSFEKSIWQRNYYEHIIRDDADLDRVREYIISNPLNWECIPLALDNF